MDIKINYPPRLSNDFTFSQDNFVIVRVWMPSNNGKFVSYPEALLRKTLNPSNAHTQVGHISLYIRHGQREEYVSLFPTELHFFSTSPAINNSLEIDIESHEKRSPHAQALLFSLDTKKMLEKFDQLQPLRRWFISGNRFIFNTPHKFIYNCSSYVETLLAEGGIYDHLLKPDQKLSDPMSPRCVYQLAERASNIERSLYPETTIVLNDYVEAFKKELLEKSRDKQNPCEAINTFLKQNPDFYLRVNTYDSNALATVLPLVYQNIQNHHNERLIALAENFHQENLNTFLIDLEKVLHAGANLSCRNKHGYNALHVLIKNNCYEGVKKILDKFPQAVNGEIKNDFLSPLNLAVAQGNEQITRLIKRHLDIIKQKAKVQKECHRKDNKQQSPSISGYGCLFFNIDMTTIKQKFNALIDDLSCNVSSNKGPQKI